MKNRILTVIIIILVVFSGCAVQEKMNPKLFIERFDNNEISCEYEIISQFTEKNKYVYFINFENTTTIVLELNVDTNNNVKKICLACKTNKTDKIKLFCEMIINAYTPNENSTEITSSLFNKGWNYYNSQWYRYSSIVIDNTIYFSIENIKLSTETDAELTLKQNN